MNAYTSTIPRPVWDSLASMSYPEVTDTLAENYEGLFLLHPEWEPGPKHITLPMLPQVGSAEHGKLVLTFDEHNKLHSYSDYPAYYYSRAHTSCGNAMYNRIEVMIMYEHGLRHCSAGPAWYTIDIGTMHRYLWNVRGKIVTNNKAFFKELYPTEKEDGVAAILKWGEVSLEHFR